MIQDTQTNHPLADRLLKAPYAFIEDEEAEVLAKMVSVIASTKSARTARDLKAALQERLRQDAETHEVCGNWIKGGIIREIIKDVGDLDTSNTGDRMHPV